jgi:hypothetical protein
MTGAVTSNACNSRVRRSKSIPRKCSSLVNSREQLNELFSEFFALRVRPFVALGPRPRGKCCAVRRLLDQRFLAFHGILLPFSGKISNLQVHRPNNSDMILPMSNPFVRLKRFIPNASHPMENHATECLAACLIFSKELRDEFIKFIFQGDIPSEIQLITGIDIKTQQPLGESGKFGRADILLSLPNHFNIIIEVKVHEQEDERHEEQLKKYWQWLESEKRQSRKHPFLFTLVKNAKVSFPCEKYNVKRRFWKDLYEHFTKFIPMSNGDATESLASNFCNYLESEGIVSTFETHDMQFYSKGLKAQRAVKSILAQVGDNLTREGFECVPIDGAQNQWPQLKIKDPAWEQIFGKGQNYNLVIWFTVPPVWGATKHLFYFELYLWHKAYGNDWLQLISKLSQWATKLENEHHLVFKITTSWSKNDSEPITGSDISKLESVPERIYACLDNETSVEDEPVPKELELVDKLSDQARKFARILSSLTGS